MGEVIVDERGRILIPKDIREQLGLQPGSPAKLEVDDGKLVVRPSLSPDEFIRLMEGCIKEGKPSIDPMNLKKIWEKGLGCYVNSLY